MGFEFCLILRTFWAQSAGLEPNSAPSSAGLVPALLTFSPAAGPSSAELAQKLAPVLRCGTPILRPVPRNCAQWVWILLNSALSPAGLDRVLRNWAPICLPVRD
jgi:hypothetical protein